MRTHFNHLALYVADLDRSSGFYRDILEAEPIPDPFRDERHAWLGIGEHNQLHLIAASKPPDPGNMHIAFSVPSLNEFVQRLGETGINYDDGHGGAGKMRLRPDGVKQIYLQDPDGYWIEVNEDRS